MEKKYSSPVFSEVGLLNLSEHPWNAPWHSNHHLVSGLSHYFHVVWCDPAPSWRKLRGNKNFIDESGIFLEPTPPGLTVYHPEKWLPEIGRPSFLAQWTSRKRLSKARNLLLSRGCRKIILFIGLPKYAFALDEVNYDLSCYRISDEYTHSETEHPVSALEAHLISRVDQVFILSPAMLAKKGHLNSDTFWVPNGVDYSAYCTSQVVPEDLKVIPHPRVGYVGILKQHLDFQLLNSLAKRHKEWSFVLVGPTGGLGQSGVLLRKLLEMDNVFWLGAKPLGALPGYIQNLDVCMLPYKINGYTKFIYPLKLHAYFGSGRPIVGTPIHTLQNFAEHIQLAHTGEDWSKAIAHSLLLNSTSQKQAEVRRQIAHQHDWPIIVDTVGHRICQKLGPIYADRFEKLLLSTQMT
jgi:hypothetical protein